MEQITSRSNPKIKLARSLRQRKGRVETSLFLVEGIRHVGEAVTAGAEIEYLCYAPDLLTSQFARQLVEQQAARGVPCCALTAGVFASLADKENPQGILAVVRQQRIRLAELGPANFAWGVAAAAPQDPGNVGAILQTIDAVGADGLLLLDSSVDPYHPSSVRASMGALFWHPVVTASFDDFAQWARRNSYHVVGASARAETDYLTVAGYQRPLVLLLGSEQEGLSPEQAAVCRQLIRLPMQGRVSSLNLAVAAGIMLYAMREKLNENK